jgi:hypothetical protein
MSGSTGFQQSNQGSNNQSQMSQQVNGPQQAALTQMYGSLPSIFAQNQNMANNGQQFAQQYSQGVANAAMPTYQNQLNGGVYQNLGIGNQLMSSLNQSLNSPSAMSQINGMIMGGNGNNYADAMKASYIGDANRTRDNMMNTLDARATGSGMSGGARQGVAEAQGNYDINSNLQHELAKTGYETFDKNLNRQLAIASQADQGTLARQQLMSGMLGQQNAAATGALQGGETMQNLGLGTMAPASAGWGNMQGWANAIGSPTILTSGSSNGSSFGKNSGMNLSGSLPTGLFGGGKGSAGSSGGSGGQGGNY